MDFNLSKMEIVPSDYFNDIDFKNSKYQRYKEKNGIIQVELKKDIYLICDSSDIDTVNAFKWYYYKNKSSRTLYSTCNYSKGRKKYFHRMILDDKNIEDKIIDHINRNGLDNRRCNLRFVSRSENALNHPVRKNNKSDYPGVYIKKSSSGRSDAWCANIRVNGKLKKTSFSIKKYGEEKAKELAILKRKEFEINSNVVIYDSPSQKVEDKPELSKELNHELIGIYKRDNNGTLSWYCEHNPSKGKSAITTSFSISKYTDNGAKDMAILAKNILVSIFSTKELLKNFEHKTKDVFMKNEIWSVRYLFYVDYKADFSIEKFGEDGAKQLALCARKIFKSVEEEKNKTGVFSGISLKKVKGKSDSWVAYVTFNKKVKRMSFATSKYENAKELAIKKRNEFVKYFEENEVLDGT